MKLPMNCRVKFLAVLCLATFIFILNYPQTRISPNIKEINSRKRISNPICDDAHFTNKTRIGINTQQMEFDQIEKLYPDLESGGHWMPKNCQAKHRVAIIVPYRDRESQLKVFLRHLHGFLRRQNLDYAIFVVEQVANQTFNRGKLMNVGIVEALKVYDWQCFIFHDVDLLPEDDRNLYTCPEQPRHMAVALNKYNYKLLYHSIFGGITALTKEQTEKINGFSNDFWGWGGEDDDLLMRVQLADYNVSRYPMEVARYTMIKHGQETANDCRFALLNQTMDKYQEDGLSNLKYKLVKFEKKHLYTEILVDLLEEESKMELFSEDFNCTMARKDRLSLVSKIVEGSMLTSKTQVLVEQVG